MKLLRVVPSANAEKKYDAVFQQDSGRTKTTSFGAKGYTDFLQSADKDRRERYLTRHKANENWNEPTTAGSLSRHLLWGDSTNLSDNIRTFKSRFNL
jgi:hypothetical protein